MPPALRVLPVQRGHRDYEATWVQLAPRVLLDLWVSLAQLERLVRLVPQDPVDLQEIRALQVQQVLRVFVETSVQLVRPVRPERWDLLALPVQRVIRVSWAQQGLPEPQVQPA